MNNYRKLLFTSLTGLAALGFYACGAGETGPQGEKGEPGQPGASCTLTANEDGSATISCPDGSSFTVRNGENGLPGDAGSDGRNGTDCTAEVNDDGDFDLICGGQKVGTIKNGEDGVGCTLDDNGDGSVTVTCGEGEGETITTIYKAVCGTKPYDPTKAFCSEGELFSCDDKPYDPKKQYCLMVTRDEMDIYSVEDLLTDARDKQNIQVYKTVKICNDETSTCQTWMAENLNYSVNPGEQSWCGGGEEGTENEGDCSVYGRLYTREAAQKACPDGWRLPSDDDWGKLFETVGGKEVAGQKLKANSDLWTHKDGISNDDSFGFAVLPAGYKFGSFDSKREFALFWTATGIDNASLYFYYKFGYNSNSGVNIHVDAAVSISVRCLKN